MSDNHQLTQQEDGFGAMCAYMYVTIPAALVLSAVLRELRLSRTAVFVQLLPMIFYVGGLIFIL